MDRATPIAERLAARYPLLYIISADEDDARATLRGLSQGAGLKLIEVRYGRLPAAEAAADALEALLKSPERSMLLLGMGQELIQNDLFVQLLREHLRAIEGGGHTLALMAPVDRPCLPLDRDRVVLRLPLPGPEELRPLVQAAFRPSNREPPPPRLVEAALRASRGMTTPQLRRALRRVRLAHPDAHEAAVAGIASEKRDLVARGGVLEVIEASEGLRDVGGMDNLKAWLDRRRRALSEEARAFGLPAPRGLLLIGVQGCGKSLFAKATASALGLPLLRFDLGRLFTHDSAPDENLRHALAITEAMAPTVLWVDELDKAFAGAMSGSDATARIFGTFITWLAEHQRGVFVAATANRVDHLPAELMRKGRFDETFFVDLPDVAVRREILSIHLQKSGRDPERYDLDELARQGEKLTGAELEQAVIEALALAFERRRDLQNSDLERAMGEIVPFVETYEQQVKELREWARRRTRAAGRDRSLRDLFLDAQRGEDR